MADRSARALFQQSAGIVNHDIDTRMRCTQPRCEFTHLTKFTHVGNRDLEGSDSVRLLDSLRGFLAARPMTTNHHEVGAH